MDEKLQETLYVVGLVFVAGVTIPLTRAWLRDHRERRLEEAIDREEQRVRKYLDGFHKIGSNERVYPMDGSFQDFRGRVIPIERRLGSQDYSIDLEQSVRDSDYLRKFFQGVGSCFLEANAFSLSELGREDHYLNITASYFSKK